MLVLFVTFLDNTVVSAALADIQSDLTAGVSALQWIVSSYALTFAGLMLTFGTLGDLYGRRLVMALGIVVLGLGSAIAATAPTSGVLIAGRVVMGVGAAAAEPGTLSMIRQLYPEAGSRARALGVWAAVSCLALALGPVVGGLLIGVWSWRGIFLTNIALGAVALIGVLAVLPPSSDPVAHGLDVVGSVLGAVALGSATFATIAGETAGYGEWWVVGLYLVAAGAAVAFVFAERRAAHPVLDLRFFRDRTFSSANVVAFTSYFATFAVFFFIPLYLQLVGTTTGYGVAVDFAPMATVLVAASVLTGRWVARRGSVLPMAVGCLLAGIGVLLTDVVITPSSGLLPLGWSLSVTGAGLGMAVVAVTSGALGAVPAARSGMAASATNTSRELGAVAGVAVLGSVVDAQITTNLVHRLAAVGMPPALRAAVITAVTTGSVNFSAFNIPGGGSIVHVIHEVLTEADTAFGHALDLVLLIAASMLLLGAVVACSALQHGPTAADRREPSTAG
jgi:EmrB/QacA subfamily drug resistance transporter